jgi:hypothetical protein
MVGVAQRLQGWTESVYRFGCAFIHLSQFHDHGSREPLRSLPSEEQATILNYMLNYHGGPQGPQPRFEELVPFFPAVLEKITSNLEHYLADLEADGVIQQDDV